MKLIIREKYLNKLIAVIGTPDIKVITGIRRSGKSKLLDSFKEYLRKNNPNCNILSINFNLPDFDELLEYKKLYSYINEHYVEGVDNFLFIDEVQMCKGFEKAINGLHALEKFDIYITGSNAFLLSSDLATLFTGRTFEIEVFPFSFSEYIKYFGSDDIYKSFENYLIDGGMSGSYLYLNQELKYDYLLDVFETLILRDIKQKYKIRNISIMNRLIDFLMDNISNLSSARNITDVFESNNEIVSHTTISSYIQYLCNAFAFYKIRRYDIRGKKYLSSTDKYYLCDHSFRYAKLGTKNMYYGRILENIVAIELLRRGYQVYVGVLYKKEIDFVAIKRSEQIYIQVSDDISDKKTFEREISTLLQIRDAYPKYVLARTKHEEYQYEGVKIIDIAQWLLKD